MNPQTHPELHVFLQRVIGFDSVDEESTNERRVYDKFPFPRLWDIEQNPPYIYWYVPNYPLAAPVTLIRNWRRIYYMYANMAGLNNWRRLLGFSTLRFMVLSTWSSHSLLRHLRFPTVLR